MTKTFDTLYARDSKGKILQWKIEVDSGSQVDIMIAYGEYGGAQTITWQRNIQGKNIGKSNETNEYEQAILEAESTIRLKKKHGYMTLDEAGDLLPNTEENKAFRFRALTSDERDTTLVLLEKYLPKYRTDAQGDIKPMKCQQYYRSKKDWIDPNGEIWDDRKYYYLKNPHVKKEKNAIITKFPCMGQPKINGVRATIKYDNKVVIKSKEGKEYNVAHINDFLNINNDIFEYKGKQLVLDGELYIHGELLQDIGSAVNKPNLNTPRIVFVLFDIAIEDTTNLDRWKLIKDHIKPKLDQHLKCPIQIIKSMAIPNDTAAQNFTDICISQGYEGAIFRQFSGMYAFGKRPQDMTKLKRCISAEFKIVDIVPQKVDPMKGNFTCITKEGVRFDVTPKGDESFKAHLLRERSRYIGMNLTCDFYEWTKDNLPFHIINNTIRDYE